MVRSVLIRELRIHCEWSINLINAESRKVRSDEDCNDRERFCYRYLCTYERRRNE